MSSSVFVQRFMHLKEMPREKEALSLLQKVASLVKPIMRKHGWVLPVLAEFYPENPGLLGININGGEKICLRLRPFFDKGAFLRLEDIVGTMLHELTHNVHGPHDQQFYQFLSKLEDEFDALQRSGYAGEGFFSRGTRLGEGVSHNPSPYVARERALVAAEKRRQLAVVMNAGNKRVGGSSREGKSMRQLAAEAAERRTKDEKSCAYGRAEAEAEAERATQWSVMDDAEEDSDPEIILLDGPPEGVTFEGTSNRTRPNQPPQAGASSSASRQIACATCTFINPTRTRNCEVCNSALPSQTAAPAVVVQTKPRPPVKNLATRPPARSTPARAPVAPAQTWDCPMCTLANAITDRRCVVFRRGGGCRGTLDPTAMSLISRHFSALGSASRLRLAPSVATKSARCASSTTSNGLVEKEEEDDFRRPSSIREEGEEDDGLDDRGDITFQQWLKDVGKNYKEPLPGQTNWLSNDRPFPMNRSFKPSAPLGADLRQTIFNLHVTDPEKHSVRELSQRFGLSLKRVEAIVRLKGEEVKWQMEGRTLRKNFERGMESAMGVRPYKPAGGLRQYWWTQWGSHYADKDADDEGAGTTPKKGVEKLWWEGVEDGKDAIVGPQLLARAARLAQKAAESEAASAQFAASHSHVVEPTVPGRAPTVFVDVGTKFTDTKEVAQRQKAAEARRRLKEKKMAA